MTFAQLIKLRCVNTLRNSVISPGSVMRVKGVTSTVTRVDFEGEFTVATLQYANGSTEKVRLEFTAGEE